jgi:hypothetical protein
MIKRLTDEPTKLVEARPDLAFPPGLQPVLDTALARTPMERYQSVTKFAADVAAVTGRAVSDAVPQTDARTQILDATGGGATQRISAKRPPPTAPSPVAARKRPLVPAAIGLVVILAAGGAWAALSGGKKANGNSPDTTAVARDTASNSGNRQSGGVTTLAVRDTGRRHAAPPPAPPSSGHPGIDPARAGDLLTDLIEAAPTVIRDSAAKIFNTPGVASGDRAFAACMVARAEEDLGNHSTAVQWANRGLAINAQLSSCQSVIRGGS